MKNYSSKQAKHGKLAYRTSSTFRFRKYNQLVKTKNKKAK